MVGGGGYKSKIQVSVGQWGGLNLFSQHHPSFQTFTSLSSPDSEKDSLYSSHPICFSTPCNLLWLCLTPLRSPQLLDGTTKPPALICPVSLGFVPIAHCTLLLGSVAPPLQAFLQPLSFQGFQCFTSSHESCFGNSYLNPKAYPAWAFPWVGTSQTQVPGSRSIFKAV